MRIGPLARDQLGEATAMLAAACAFDQADVVAEEKLFAGSPTEDAHPFGAWDAARLVGVAAVSGRRIRVLAVVPAVRRHGYGSALLEACVAHAKQAGRS